MGVCVSISDALNKKEKELVASARAETHVEDKTDLDLPAFENEGAPPADVAGKPSEDRGETSGDVSDFLCRTQFGGLFSAHPELLKSSSAAVMCTGVFLPGETVGEYRVVRELSVGAVGRGFFVTLSRTSAAAREQSSVVAGENTREETFVFKVITFSNRRSLMEPVMDDERKLMSLTSESVLCPVNILVDDKKETTIFVTPYLGGGSCVQFAGAVEEEKFLSILRDVAAALQFLHANNIYHHNLKLENVLLKNDGKACVADAGLWRIFTSQSRECLLFNGELACMPPERLIEEKTGEGTLNISKIDVWGLGVFMYRLAYGKDPFEIEGKTLKEVCKCIFDSKLCFPERGWTSVDMLEELISACLSRDPEDRPSLECLLSHPLLQGATSDELVFRGCGSTSMFRTSIYGLLSSGVQGKFENYLRWTCSRYHWRNHMSVEEVLGVGRFCETFRVRLRHCLSKQYAMKVLRRSTVKKASQYGINVNRLYRDLLFCRQIGHPNLLSVVEIVDSSDGCFAAQQLVTGKFLNTDFPPLINETDNLFTVRQMLVDVLQGLYVLHLNGVPHFHLTPSNVFYEKGVGFRIADFGPLFLTKEEVTESLTSEKPFYKLPQWVIDDLKLPLNECKFYLDSFFVGLLAASASPTVLHEDWARLCGVGDKGFDMDEVIDKVKKASIYYKPALVDFVERALTVKVTVKELMAHPYVSLLVNKKDVETLRPCDISSADASKAVADKFVANEECRLWNVLGQDPTACSSYVWGAVVAKDEHYGNGVCSADRDSGEIKAVTRMHFVHQLLCGLCRSELPIVLFLCNKCPNYIRCAKCSIVDEHAEDHKLTPHLIHTIEHGDDNNRLAFLVPTRSINVTNPLEELEMQANLPHGTLTKDIHTASAPNERMVRRATKASMNVGHKVLPKPSDIDDDTWQDEVMNCRQNRNPELLLFRFGLTSVPGELFDPPLVHVVSVDLSYNKLTSLPSELALFVKLKSLSVAHNMLSALPPSLGELSQLDHLDASHNHLRDLPRTFEKLWKLRTITLDFNEFKELPPVLDKLISATATAPLLSIIYLAQNPNITKFPRHRNLAILPALKLALDNEPTVYKMYVDQNLAENLPNVGMLWNKIYPDRIVDRVFCGSLRTTQSQLVYDKLGIKALLTVGRDLVAIPPVGGRHHVISLDDIEGADISCTFEEAVSFIDVSVRRGEGCLVHCFAGLSRSATTVIAYLMMKRGMRLDDAYRLTRRGRPSIYPNEGFFQQMLLLDRELFPGSRPLKLDDLGRSEV